MVVDAHPRRDGRVVGQAVGLAAGDDGDAPDQSASSWGCPRCDEVPISASPAAATSPSVASTTGTWNSAPAEARTTFGLNTSTEPGVTTTASTPAASAERRIVPTLPGSASAVGDDDEAGGVERARAGSGLATSANRPVGRSVAVMRSATPGPSRWAGVPAHGVDAGRVELRLDAPPGGQRLGDERRALDDEGALVPTRTAAPLEAPQPLDPGVGERQAGARAGPGVHGRRRAQAAWSAAFAVSTSRPKAAASVTARSARILRSTSMPAALSPAMNRL